MKDPLKSRKIKSTYEINWNIREIFSESALTNFCDEMDNKNLSVEKNYSSINSFFTSLPISSDLKKR